MNNNSADQGMPACKVASYTQNELWPKLLKGAHIEDSIMEYYRD